MANLESKLRELPRSTPADFSSSPLFVRARPMADLRGCAACFRVIDALRASRVVFTPEKPYFFCSCKCQNEFRKALARQQLKARETVALAKPPASEVPVDLAQPRLAEMAETTDVRPGIGSLGLSILGLLSTFVGVFASLMTRGWNWHAWLAIAAACCTSLCALARSTSLRQQGYHGWLAAPLASCLVACLVPFGHVAVVGIAAAAVWGANLTAVSVLLRAHVAEKAQRRWQQLWVPHAALALPRASGRGDAGKWALLSHIGRRFALPFVWSTTLAAILLQWRAVPWPQALLGALLALACTWLAAPLLTWGWSVATHIGAGWSALLRSGVRLPDLAAMETASKVAVVALETHGTLTYGTPRIVRVLPLASLSHDELLAHAAAAEEAAAQQAIAKALRAAAAHAGTSSLTVSCPEYVPGRGVRAFAAGSGLVCVGNRQWLIDEGISVAGAEPAAVELESHGWTVLFVAVDRKLQGVLALEDPLRPGSRRQLQSLHDHRIEIALFSGGQRNSLEPLAATLGVSHLKTGLLPHERALDMQRLRDTGVTVATIAHLDHPTTLSHEADLSMLVGTTRPTSQPLHASVVYAPSIGDATAALSIAHATRAGMQRAMAIGGIGGLVLLAAAALGLVSPAVAATGATLIELLAWLSVELLLRRVQAIFAAKDAAPEGLEDER